MLCGKGEIISFQSIMIKHLPELGRDLRLATKCVRWQLTLCLSYDTCNVVFIWIGGGNRPFASQL